MFVLTVLEKIKEARLTFCHGSVTVLKKITNYQEARVKLTNSQLKKLKSTAKNKTRTILKVNKKNYEHEKMPHELFVTKMQTTKVRNAFANNISTDIKLNKSQTSKMTQSGGKRKRFTLFISNEDINYIIKVIKLFEDSGVLIDGVTETVKYEIKV